MVDAASCAQQWREVDLDAVRYSLDSQAEAFLANRERSLEIRRQLAADTAALREAPPGDDAAFRDNAWALLGHYGAAVEQLTERSTFAEQSFLAIYRLIRFAPDPAPVLESLQAHLAEKDAEARVLEKSRMELQDQLRVQLRALDRSADRDALVVRPLVLLPDRQR